MTTAVKKYPVRAPKDRRAHDVIACPNCGTIRWDRAPVLFKVYKHLAQRGPKTTAEVAEAVGVSISNASDKLKRLCGLGVVKLADSQNIPEIGGVMNTYAVVDG